MFKKNFFITTALLFIWLNFAPTAFGQNQTVKQASGDEFMLKLSKFSAQQLLDTAEYYVNNNSNDTALICYNLIINTFARETDKEQQKKIIVAYNKAAVLNYYLCDFRTAYELLIKGLLLCEKINYDEYQTRILSNIGIIYFRFNKYDLSKDYYAQALQLCKDTTVVEVILNNLGEAELYSGNMDSAYYYLSKALYYSKQNKEIDLHTILNTMATYYEKQQQYDSAFYYYRSSFEVSKKKNKIETQAESLSNLGNLFFIIGKKDSAIYYIQWSNMLANENNLPRILVKNYDILSQIEESKGDTTNAFEYFKKHASLKDSIFNVEKFADINQLQRLYEVSKTNQQIEQLTIEQRVNEQTIHYQSIIQFITLGILISVSIISLFIYFQKTDYPIRIIFQLHIQFYGLF